MGHGSAVCASRAGRRRVAKTPVPVAYYVVVSVHVLAAMLWLGGMLFLGVVGAPVLRAVEPAALRQRLFNVLGRRFRGIGWGAIAVLVVTGALNLHYRGWLHRIGGVGDPAFWRTRTGIALAVKLAAVVLMVIVSAVHDFVIGPRAGEVEAGSVEAVSLRRRAATLARVSTALGVVVVVAAVVLAR